MESRAAAIDAIGNALYALQSCSQSPTKLSEILAGLFTTMDEKSTGA